MFFDLPRELRDHIYDHVLSGVKVTFSDRQVRSGRAIEFSLYYQSDDSATRPKLPTGLLASKQMLEEALAQLYRHASCSLTARCACTGCEVVGGRCQYYPGDLISISRVQNFDGPVQKYVPGAVITFKLRQGFKEGRTLSPEYLIPVRESESAEDETIPDSFFNYLRQHPDHPAKQIKFSFNLPIVMMDMGGPLAPWLADFSPFWSLGPRFDRVVMRIVCPSGPNERAPWKKLRAHAIMFKRLQMDLTRTAIILVGGSDTSGYSVRDYMKEGVEEGVRKGPGEGPLEWHVEARRRPSEQNICIRYKGLRCFKTIKWTSIRTGWDFHKIVEVEESDVDHQGCITWYCPGSGEVKTTALPLDSVADGYTQQVDGLENVSKALETAFHLGD